MRIDFTKNPQAFWQDVFEPGTFDPDPAGGHRGFYPATLPDGRQLALPIRVLGDGKQALASLIITQAGFPVLEALADALAGKVSEIEPEIIVGLPTLGLTLASETARRLGHTRYVPLSTSQKFWYRQDLSVPLRSITSPDQEKRLFMDPRMLPLLEGRRVLLIDDVLSSGTSIKSGLDLLDLCGVRITAIGAAMLQTRRWYGTLSEKDPDLPGKVFGVFRTPLLEPVDGGGWRAQEKTDGSCGTDP